MIERPVLTRLDSPKLAAAITAVAYYLFIVLRLSTHGYDVSYFVTAGDQFNDPQLVPQNLQVLRDSAGYDGQFYYRLALDPFTAQRTTFGNTLDLPATRQSRIIYPLLVWLLSLRHSEFVPVLMLGVNYLALCMIGWLGGLAAQSFNRHALWGLTLSFYAGLLIALSRDLTEILAVSVVLAALLAIRRGRDALAVVLLTIAALTRETTLVVVVSVLLVRGWAFVRGAKRDNKIFLYLIPLCVYALWAWALFARWGQFALGFGSLTFGFPLAGFISFLASTTAFANRYQVVWFFELCFVLALTVACAWLWRSSRAAAHEKLAWLFYGMFAVLWSNYIWVEDWAYLRQLSEFYLFGALILLASPSRLKFPLCAWGAALWLVLAREIIWFR